MHSIHAFAEKVALVTGGSSPIGRAVAMQLALLGAFVVSADESEGSAENELRALGTLAATVTADVATDEGAADAVAAAEKSYGRIDLIVNCLKSPPESSFLDTDGDELASGARLALAPPVLVLKHAHRLLSERPKARVVNVLPGREAESATILHSAARGAVERLTNTVAAQLPRSFRFNSVVVDAAAAVTGGGIVAERIGVQPDDVARTVLFLLSSESTAINGQTLIVG